MMVADKAESRIEDRADFLAGLASAQANLNKLASSTETEINSVTQSFRGLTGETSQILQKAAAIVASVEDENVAAVHPQVQALSVTVRAFLEKRLEAATAILHTLLEQERLLRQLNAVAQSQEAIAGHLKALSVLTNVEVAQLGNVGSGFQFLASELSAFANSVTEQTLELARNAESRMGTIEDTRRELAATLPGLRAELARTEEDLGKTLQAIDDDLGQLATVPGRFRTCAQATGEQIAGVVAAIQSHDITRQQIEHVQESLQLLSAMMTTDFNTQMHADAGHQVSGNMSTIYGGLILQISQLKNIKETGTNWVSQVRRCIGGIEELSASDVVNIGAIVLNQERGLSTQLAHIEQLQQRSQVYGTKIQQAVKELFSLVELVNEHLERSQVIRQRLQSLTFNSLIEAHHLGHQGAVVSSIANLIKAVSAEWIVITDRSRLTVAEIVTLVNQTKEVMEAFSEANSKKLSEDQHHSGTALDSVRSVAAYVGKEAAQMQIVTERMQAYVQQASNTRGLDRCFGYLDAALVQIQGITQALLLSDPHIAKRYDPDEVERLFGSGYTTEIERHILNAALRGVSMPVVEQSHAGNTVELF
jgi:hypothetical protein